MRAIKSDQKTKIVKRPQCKLDVRAPGLSTDHLSALAGMIQEYLPPTIFLTKCSIRRTEAVRIGTTKVPIGSREFNGTVVWGILTSHCSLEGNSFLQDFEATFSNSTQHDHENNESGIELLSLIINGEEKIHS